MAMKRETFDLKDELVVELLQELSDRGISWEIALGIAIFVHGRENTKKMLEWLAAHQEEPEMAIWDKAAEINGKF